jgi:hypothetical protein
LDGDEETEEFRKISELVGQDEAKRLVTKRKKDKNDTKSLGTLLDD